MPEAGTESSASSQPSDKNAKPTENPNGKNGTAPVEADRRKLMESFLEKKTPVTPPANSYHERKPLDYSREDLLPAQIEGMSLNQARTTMEEVVRKDERAHGYNPEIRVLGYGTERNNPNNPFLDPAKLYKPDSKLMDFAKGSSANGNLPRELVCTDPFDLQKQTEEFARDPFHLKRADNNNALHVQLTPSERARALGIKPATEEEQKEWERREAIRELAVRDPLLRNPTALSLRLKDNLTPQQQQVYANQQELQAVLRTEDALGRHIDRLQAEYDKNHWQEDSHWYGLDDGKFLEDIHSRNPGTVSNYDKFRVLAIIDRTKTHNKAIFEEKDLNKLTAAQKKFRSDIENQELKTRRQITEKLSTDITRLEILLGNQHGRQGLISDGLDEFVGEHGTPGGWGGCFMDSDATSKAVNEHLEAARQASQRLLALPENKCTNLEFAQAYEEHRLELSKSLLQASDHLGQLSEAQKQRVEGFTDIAQMVAMVGVGVTAVPSGGSSLAAIPLIFEAGAVTKTVPKLIEAETAAMAGEYKPEEMLKDIGMAAVMSILPGSKIAKPLVGAEKLVIKEVALAEGEQLFTRAAEDTLLQPATQTGQRVVQRLGSLAPQSAAEIAEKQTAAEIVKRQTVNLVKHGLEHATAGSIDGAVLESSRAALSGEDVLEAAHNGVINGAMLGTALGPALKIAGKGAQRIGRYLKDAAEKAETRAAASAGKTTTAIEGAIASTGKNVAAIENTDALANSLNAPKKSYRQDPGHDNAGGKPNQPSPTPTDQPNQGSNAGLTPRLFRPDAMTYARPATANIHDATPGPEGAGGTAGEGRTSTNGTTKSNAAETATTDGRKSSSDNNGRAKERFQSDTSEPSEIHNGRKSFGDREQTVVARKLDKALGEMQGESGKTLAEEGWEVREAEKDSPADHAHIDLALVNEKLGIYYIVDVTTNTVIDGTNGPISTSDRNSGAKVASTQLHLNAIVKRDDVLISPHNSLYQIFKKGTPLSLELHPPPPMRSLGSIPATQTALIEFQHRLASSADPQIRAYGRDLTRNVIGLGHVEKRTAAAQKAARVREQLAATEAKVRASDGYKVAQNNFQVAVDGAFRKIIGDQFREQIGQALQMAGYRGPAPIASSSGSKAVSNVKAAGNTITFKASTDRGDVSFAYSPDAATRNAIVADEWGKAVQAVPKEYEYVIGRIQKQAKENVATEAANPKTLEKVADSLAVQTTEELLGSRSLLRSTNAPNGAHAEATTAPGENDMPKPATPHEEITNTEALPEVKTSEEEKLPDQPRKSEEAALTDDKWLAEELAREAVEKEAEERWLAEEIEREREAKTAEAAKQEAARAAEVARLAEEARIAEAARMAEATKPTDKPAQTERPRVPQGQGRPADRPKPTERPRPAERSAGNVVPARPETELAKKVEMAALNAIADQASRSNVPFSADGQYVPELHRTMYDLLTNGQLEPPVRHEIKKIYGMYKPDMPAPVLHAINDAVGTAVEARVRSSTSARVPSP